MRRKITYATQATVLLILFLSVLFIISGHKHWDYERIHKMDYNEGYNENHKPIDTVLTYYKNTKPIVFRKFIIDGHSVIGELNGGSRSYIIHDLPNCEKCTNYFLSLDFLKANGERNNKKPSISNTCN